MLYFTKDHEWLRFDGELAVIGITEHAAEALGDIVFFEGRDPGTRIPKGEPVGTVESVKAASDIYAPLAGEIVAVNTALADNPEQINLAPTAGGWLVKLKLDDPSELATLMDEQAYLSFIS